MKLDSARGDAVLELVIQWRVSTTMLTGIAYRKELTNSTLIAAEFSIKTDMTSAELCF